MKKKIILYWYKHSEGYGNFGDELSPYIIKHLTGKKINHLPIVGTRFNRAFKLIKRTLLNQISYKNFISVIQSMKFKEYHIAIGSIIGGPKGKYCNVWGSGLMEKDEKIDKCKFYAVRGEVTRNRIKELGYNAPLAIGDPALLMPIIYHPNSKKKYDLGIIPHFIQKDELSKKLIENKENILIIDLLKNVESVIEQINSCKKTISSSLHGIIVSHAYGIPSLWCKLGENPLAGDNIKFDDYFSSVDIPFYNRISIDLDNHIISTSNKLFEKYTRHSLNNNNIDEIQRSLINHAPFEILDKYKM